MDPNLRDKAKAPLDDTGSEPPLDASGDRPTVAADTYWTGTEVVTFEATASDDRYQTLETIGEGGMGEIRLCSDRRIGRQIAMKLLRKDRAKRTELQSRFFREVRAQGQLEHPSIVPVYDVGTDPTGALFFTMKRVRGETLQQIIKGLRAGDPATVRQHSLHKLLTAFASACLAVDFAHSRGVIHCDLKPANLMLGDFGEVYVLDWGLAKLPSGEDKAGVPASEPQMVHTGDTPRVSGTPGYMAPEQIQGEPLDPRADVYALGATLYELLTLSPMHAGSDPNSLCRATLRGVEVRPSVRAPDRDIDPELEGICMRATALEPRDRYASAREMYEDLQRFLEGDRDMTRRRHLSLDHARLAAAAADEALAGGSTAAAQRGRAMREVGRALALNPNNVDALRTLVRLLTEPPRELPKEAVDDIRAAERGLQRVRARAGGFAFLTWMFFVPIALIQGVQNMTFFVLATLAWAASAGICFAIARHPRPDGLAPLYLPVAAGLAIGFSTLVMGPYVLAPGFAAVFGLGMSLSTDRSRRYVPMLTACLSIAVPMVLEWTGVLPPSCEMRNGAVCVLPRMLAFPNIVMTILLPANLIVIVMACYFGLRFRDVLTDMQRRLHLHAWQLRQLVPNEAQGPLSVRPEA